MIAALTTPERAALIVLVGAAATLGGAWIFEYGLGYLPCALCLKQREPYYFGIPLALAAYFLVRGGYLRQGGLALIALALMFIYSSGFGAYHSGVEWGWWPGPSACAATGELATDATSLLEGLGKTTAPSCTEAALRIFGLSLAGYNFLISAALAAIALIGGIKARKGGAGAQSAATN